MQGIRQEEFKLADPYQQKEMQVILAVLMRNLAIEGETKVFLFYRPEVFTLCANQPRTLTHSAHYRCSHAPAMTPPLPRPLCS